MRNVVKAATLESKFPLLSVEEGCIISKDADITVAYRVELPELFTLTQASTSGTFRMGQGGEGAAGIQHRAQAGFLH